MTESELVDRCVNRKPVYVIKFSDGKYDPLKVFINTISQEDDDGCNAMKFHYYIPVSNERDSGYFHNFYSTFEAAKNSARMMKIAWEMLNKNPLKEEDKLFSEKKAESNAKDRGYFGIGIFNGKTPSNIGTLWRSASILGASFIFTIGERYRHQCSDTTKAFRHIPLYHYENYEDFLKHVPHSCPVVAVELDESAVPVEDFVHPERCIYLLGAEDGGIPKDIINRCQSTVQLMGDYCYNVAVAGSLVMYDRKRKERTG